MRGTACTFTRDMARGSEQSNLGHDDLAEALASNYGVDTYDWCHVTRTVSPLIPWVCAMWSFGKQAFAHQSQYP
jgi:hypothetical protein